MHKSFRLKGLCSAPATPFKENGDINLPVIKDYVQHFVDFGVPNAFVIGTTGEGNNMTVEERKQVAEEWIKQGRGKLKTIILHIGANNLRESKELAKHAESIGADAISCVGTAFYKPQTMQDYVDYMADVAAAAPNTPFLLYDIDFMTGIKHDVSTFMELAKPRIPTLCGVKHTSPNFISIFNTHVDHPDVQVILGGNETLIQAMSIGVEETVMVSYMGHILNRLREAYHKGDMEKARLEAKRAHAIRKIKQKYGCSVPLGTKSILNLIGLNVGQPRCPLSPISEENSAKLKKDLEDIGFFDWGLKI